MNSSCHSYQQQRCFPQCQFVCTVKGDPGPQGPQGPPGTPGTPGTILVPGPDGSLLRSNSTSPTGFDFVGNINIPPGTNAFLGQNSGTGVTSGTENTAFGQNALAAITSGSGNTAVGFNALAINATASENTAVGRRALQNNTSGTNNTAIGDFAMSANTSGNQNTTVGADSFSSNTTGFSNTSVGWASLFANTSGAGNVAIGTQAMELSTIGGDNTAVGNTALAVLTAGGGNVALGAGTLINLGSGTNNTAVGPNAGSLLATGSSNLLLGSNSQVSGNQSNDIVIGSITSTAVSGRTFIAQIFGLAVGGDGLPVFVDSNNLLGTSVSSRAYKENINPIQDDISAKLLALNPVTFTFKNDEQHRLQFGLIAEEVSEVIPEIVVMKKADDESEPKPNAVRYEQIIPMLLYQIQRQDKEIEILKSKIVDIQSK